MLLTISGIALVATVASDFFRPQTPEERLQHLRIRLTDLRSAADSCRDALEQKEVELHARDEGLDSLRDKVEAYESLHPEGVPAESYEDYIDAFEGYNRGIPERNAEAKALQVHWAACREIAEIHNVTADSALRLASELGLVRDDPIRESNE